MRLLLLLFLTLNLLNAQKIALLIGNNDYSFQPLNNPLNDVDGIYKTLIEIGFKKSNIKVLKNASKTKMESELANFSQRATSAQIALVYFSGHGMQVNNTNYMFPAKTTATKPIHLRTLVDLDYFIESASSAKYGIILVDACRNNPLVKYFQNGKHKGENKKGLGQVTPTVGQVVIGFATGAGDTADDGGESMSPYARALVNNLTLNRDITKVLGKVAVDVRKDTENKQSPIVHTTLVDDVILTKSDNKFLQPSTPKIVKKVDSDPKSIISSKTKGITIVDGLMYQNQAFSKQDVDNYKNSKNGGRVWTWSKAKTYCKKLTINDLKNWRLPTKNELEKILTQPYNDYNPMDSNSKAKKSIKNSRGDSFFVKKEFVENMPSLINREYASVWTSIQENSYASWYGEFTGGYARGWSAMSVRNYVLCVKNK